MMTLPVKVSINVTSFSWSEPPAAIPPALRAVAQAADRAGIDTLWVADHLMQADPHAAPDSAMLEAYTALGWLAAATERIRLGTMVSAVTYRPAALLITAVTTLDVLSGGRAWLGIGAGYHEQEATAYGLPLPAMAERFEQLEDTLVLARRMWSGAASPFTGRRLRLERPFGSPPPATRPHSPILVGGGGERRTLRLVAEHADACNLFDIPDGGVTIRRKLEVLRRHCDDVGRDPAAIQRTLSTRLGEDESVEEFAARCRGLAKLGIDHLVLHAAGDWTAEAVDALAGHVAAAAAA
jgi:F420-dependent oxidoreductase-like protein